jgi:hypothetical protein
MKSRQTILAIKPMLAITSLLLLTHPASAQSTTVQPSSDWNGNWGFSSTADRTLRLLQADAIEKKDSGYYESFGPNVYNVTNDVTNNVSTTTTFDHRVGSFDTISGEAGAQIQAHSSTAVGSINNSHTAIAIDGEDNSVTAVNSSESVGCQDAGISVLTEIQGGNSIGPSNC